VKGIWCVGALEGLRADGRQHSHHEGGIDMSGAIKLACRRLAKIPSLLVPRCGERISSLQGLHPQRLNGRRNGGLGLRTLHVSGAQETG
jgi:hypothetical protein